ncbi:proteasome subunit beta type-7-like [Symsagittifera roscoffensis]|uniref:proteasome subunit beta type-7-like n=1 Tax=Symsagittifera roscoffensis TaxID=84072 RepID=UPI00307C2F32
MATVSCLKLPEGGFSFENCKRNSMLAQRQGVKLPKAKKTGTTIIGVVFKDGVVLGADTRATEGDIVADKNCEKLHFIADNMRCGGAGTAADTEWTCDKVAAEMKLVKLNSGGRDPRVVAAMMRLKQYLFNYQGYISAALILGGVDSTGPHLFEISPNGTTAPMPFVAMGSGCLAALSVLEAGYTPDMDEESAKKLAKDAISAGIFNDLGSGSNVDLCVIKKGTCEYLRTFASENPKGTRQGDYTYPSGTTAVKKREVMKVDLEIVSEEVMETD